MQNPTDKEVFYQKYRGNPYLLSLREMKRNKPLVEVKVATPYDKYLTVKSLQSALDRLPEVGTHVEASNLIRQHIRKEMASAPADKPVIIALAEMHDEDLAVTGAMSTLHLLEPHSQKKYLAELTPRRVARFQRDEAEERRAAFQAAEAAGTGFTTTDMPVHPSLARALTNCTYALEKGFDIEGMDTLHASASSQDAREAAMVENIAREAREASVTVVSTGRVHLPYLHEKLSRNFHVIAVMHAAMPEKGDHEALKRVSYGLAKQDQILMLRPSSELGQEPIDAIELQRRFT
ncbi:hypothetical protein HLB44_36395 [Aquincola sp. S2]|uniref:Uncharacterized protein n=1 Tax=Pseudaquabacterium terrae TaxID=2732868 RepID=A0ABX2EVJ2_9BURK|nr:hypothetical protein [Aquabacterium terrae]NRF72444.1 hypothetical protein [Aquabacterium terrae]